MSALDAERGWLSAGYQHAVQMAMNNFLLGLGVGITVGVLFAPKTGGETREYLGNRAAEGADYLSGQAQQLKESASGLVDRGRNIISDQKDKVASTAENFQHQMQQS